MTPASDLMGVVNNFILAQSLKGAIRFKMVRALLSTLPPEQFYTGEALELRRELVALMQEFIDAGEEEHSPAAQGSAVGTDNAGREADRKGSVSRPTGKRKA